MEDLVHEVAVPEFGTSFNFLMNQEYGPKLDKDSQHPPGHSSQGVAQPEFDFKNLLNHENIVFERDELVEHIPLYQMSDGSGISSVAEIQAASSAAAARGRVPRLWVLPCHQKLSV